MKRRVILILLLFVCVTCYSKKQNKFAFFYFRVSPDSLIQFKDYYLWKINSTTVSLNGDTIKLKIHYPGFDTIQLTDKSNKYTRTIITRFYPGHVYELTEFSECPDAQIHDMFYYKPGQTDNWKNEIGTVLFKLKNYKDSILIAGIYGNVRLNFTRGKILTNSKTIRIDDPILTEPSCFFFHVRIGTGCIRKENDLYEDYRFTNFRLDSVNVFAIEENLIQFEYKFFHREQLTIIYDHKIKLPKLKLK